MNPSEEPAVPHRPDHPFAGTAAEPALHGSSSDAGRAEPAGAGLGGPAAAADHHEPPHRTEPSAASATEEQATADRAAQGLAAQDPVPHALGAQELAAQGPAPEGYAAESYGREGYGGEGYADVWPAPAPSPRPLGRTVRVAVLTGLVVLVLGAPLGLLWHWLAPTVPVLDAGSSGIVVNDPSPEEYVAADGWYTMLALGFGLIVAVAAWLVLRRDRGPFLLLAVVVGTFGAGYLVGPWVGGLIGRAGYHHWQQTAVQGATYHAPPQVHSVGPRLVAAFAAAIVLTLMAGWSNDPDLDAPGAKPGYDANTRPATDA